MTQPAAIQGTILHAVAWMLLSTVLSTFMQAGIRLVSDDLHPFEIAFFRNCLPLIFMVGWFSRVGWSALKTGNIKLHVVRGAVNAGAMLCFFTGVTIAPFATVTALGFTAPLFAALGAVLFLGERMRLRRWLATLTGFAGVLVLVRPGYMQIGLGEILLLAAAMCWSVALLLIKTMSRTDSAWTITTYMNLLLTPLTLPFALYVWVWPTPTQLLWLAGIAALGTLGQTALNHALRHGEIAVVMPMEFMRLVWASVIGAYIFAEPTSIWTWIGGLIIVASTSYIAYRESVVRRQAVRGQQ
jgi:drug/metabolite transporter (DMT)-like permease